VSGPGSDTALLGDITSAIHDGLDLTSAGQR
jgi:hypothetical protein